MLNVRDGAAVADCARETGAVDVLFNCAGFVHAGTVLDCDEADWDFSMDLNVKAMYRTIRAYLPLMLERGGSIINMASAASSVKGVPNRFVYGASKAAVIGLSKAVAADFVARGIRCNAICPGTVESPSLRERIAAQAPAGQRRSRGARRLRGAPAHRPRRPGGGGGRAGGLPASDESAFTTGTIQVIDGGWSN